MPGGIKIVNEANLSCQHNLDTMERQDLLSGRTFINLDNSGWSGGVATVVPQVARMDKVEAGARMKEEQELDPDEEEKRRVRRERNKLAAARCRKRRVEQIEGLQREVDDWEDKKRMLQEEISSLQSQREDLQFILDAHRHVCKRLSPDQVSQHSLGPRVLVKSEPELDQSYSDHLSTSENMEAILRPQRPVSLSLKTVPLRNIEGVSIDTPSSGISLNFDALMEGRTGLTPTNVLAPININLNSLGPSCGSQQRSGLSSISAAMTELASPSSSAPNLVSL